MNIKELENKCLKPILYSVYGNSLCGDTIQDLLSNMVAYINESIKQTNDNTTLVNGLYDWVRNQGLKEEVIKQLNIMVDNGTFDRIINQEVFGDLSNDVEILKGKDKDKENRLAKIENELKNVIHVEEFGAKGDGVTDDTIAIRKCFEYVMSVGGTVNFSGRTYCVSEELLINKIMNVNFNGATLKKIGCSVIDSVIKIRQLIDGDSPLEFDGAMYGRMGYYNNLTIDCNGTSKYGFWIYQANRGKIDNIEVFNATEVGINIRSCHELAVTNIRAQSCPVGLRIESTDVNLRGYYARFCKIGIENLGGSNFYSDVHCWNYEETYRDSIFMVSNAPFMMDNCYSDTYETSFKLTRRTTAHITNFKAFWAQSVIDVVGTKPLIFMYDYPISVPTNNVVVNNWYVDAPSNGVDWLKETNNGSTTDVAPIYLDETVLTFRTNFIGTSIIDPSKQVVFGERYSTSELVKGDLNEETFSKYKLNSHAITMKDRRVYIHAHIERTGTYTTGAQEVAYKLSNVGFRLPKSTTFAIPYADTVGGETIYKIDGITYCQISSAGELRIKMPVTENYNNPQAKINFYINITYDLDGWNIVQ